MLQSEVSAFMQLDTNVTGTTYTQNSIKEIPFCHSIYVVLLSKHIIFTRLEDACVSDN
jgi:hypothetical protein